MKIDVVTIFPEMVEQGLSAGVIGRARQAGVLDVAVHNLRDFTTDRHRVVDDVPFGGGPGMVLKPEPLFKAVESIAQTRGTPDAVVVMSPAGRTFVQATARRLAACGHIVVLCGRYEGIDERVCAQVATEELSIGDYVLSGGELPALVVIDAVGRLVPGVVGDAESVEAESFTRGLLDYPHYTRPAEFRGQRVPDVLTSGHHADIRAWRREAALRRTVERRPDLLAEAELEPSERAFLRTLGTARGGGQAAHEAGIAPGQDRAVSAVVNADASAPEQDGAIGSAPGQGGAARSAPGQDGAVGSAPRQDGAVGSAPGQDGAVGSAPRQDGADGSALGQHGAATAAPRQGDE